MSFLSQDYLLRNNTARALYAGIQSLPIVDPHNHADPREIVENQGWSDIWQVEGATDHYVWELMRRRGIPESRITGDASNREKWEALAGCFSDFIGNPTYEWIHLDLKRRFGIEEIVSADTAEIIWDATGDQLGTDRLKPQAILQEMGVEIMCTTDDPTLKLPFHEAARSREIRPTILPTWRPDKAMNPGSATWKSFLQRLGEETDQNVDNLQGLLDALGATHRYFQRLGCRASDHGLNQPFSAAISSERARAIHESAWAGRPLDSEAVRDYNAYLLHQFGLLNEEAGWVTQLHIGPVRDYRDQLRDSIGPDSGGDISTQSVEFVENLRHLLNYFDGKLQIVLYAVDPTHLPTLATLARAFPNLILGAPWWWNDSPLGMEEQLKYLGTVDLLSCHAGMVTDSRKLMSFGSRTEMFRRVLCQVLGDLVERGQAPRSAAEKLAADLAYHRPHGIFFD